MPNKILIFSTAYFPFVGGAEVAVKEITSRIEGVNFDLITAKMDKNLPSEEKVGRINVYRVGFGFKKFDKLLLPFLGAIKALNLGKKNTYKAYWCIMVTFASGAAYVANIFARKKVPIILTIQEGDSEKYLETRRVGLVDLSWRLSLKRTNIVTVISSYLGDRVRRSGFKGKIKLIPNGVDVKNFSVDISEDEKNSLRQSLGLNSGDIALVTSSRLNVKNGVGDVIKAMPLISDNIKFFIFGVGELENALKNLSKDLNLERRVIFKGLVNHSDLPKFLKSCDIFIRPSLSEGFGNSFIEAMAAKLPVIATPVGGIVDFLEDGKTGYFCEPENPDSIATAINKVINDIGENRIIDNAYRMVIEKYDWDLISKQMKEIFDNVVK